ncbi:hypothetical protein RFI_28052 [Reticulomyxa filosa]|uniref:SET domain-containing protein n=1 Tax=Reticulomyxa filosa TaxID=46433 RepID=X6M8I9_RETFI|nr:hypothetical protein RFI_28052 [Reticulomyxa filosa]|eukprot:ETO09335.1 hypothetical protein RFI_28052 [Reticulomyxa filosa]
MRRTDVMVEEVLSYDFIKNLVQTSNANVINSHKSSLGDFIYQQLFHINNIFSYFRQSIYLMITPYLIYRIVFALVFYWIELSNEHPSKKSEISYQMHKEWNEIVHTHMEMTEMNKQQIEDQHKAWTSQWKCNNNGLKIIEQVLIWLCEYNATNSNGNNKNHSKQSPVVSVNGEVSEKPSKQRQEQKENITPLALAKEGEQMQSKTGVRKRSYSIDKYMNSNNNGSGNSNGWKRRKLTQTEFKTVREYDDEEKTTACEGCEERIKVIEALYDSCVNRPCEAHERLVRLRVNPDSLVMQSHTRKCTANEDESQHHGNNNDNRNDERGILISEGAWQLKRGLVYRFRNVADWSIEVETSADQTIEQVSNIEKKITRFLQLNSGRLYLANPLIAPNNFPLHQNKVLCKYQIKKHERIEALNGQIGIKAKMDIPKHTIIGQHYGVEFLCSEFEWLYGGTSEEWQHNTYAHTINVKEETFNNYLKLTDKRQSRSQNNRSDTTSVAIVIDPCSLRGTSQEPLLMFLNDCRLHIESVHATEQDLMHENVEFLSCTLNGWPTLFAWTSKDVKKEEELFLYYGKYYNEIMLGKQKWPQRQEAMRDFISQKMQRLTLEKDLFTLLKNLPFPTKLNNFEQSIHKQDKNTKTDKRNTTKN